MKEIRIVPHNRKAEIFVIGGLMMSPIDELGEIMDIVKPGDFYDTKHREIFQAITTLYNRNSRIDIITVSEELKKQQSLEMVGGRVYIASLTADVPTSANVEEYAKIVAENAFLRRLIIISNDIVDHALNKVGRLMERRIESVDCLPEAIASDDEPDKETDQ